MVTLNRAYRHAYTFRLTHSKASHLELPTQFLRSTRDEYLRFRIGVALRVCYDSSHHSTHCPRFTILIGIRESVMELHYICNDRLHRT